MIADLSYLNALLGYDPDRTQRFIEIYQKELPAQLGLLVICLQEGNRTELATIAHGIKNQSAYLGAEEVIRLAHRLETEAEQHVPDNQLFILIQDLRIAVTHVIDKLRGL